MILTFFLSVYFDEVVLYIEDILYIGQLYLLWIAMNFMSLVFFVCNALVLSYCSGVDKKELADCLVE